MGLTLFFPPGDQECDQSCVTEWSQFNLDGHTDVRGLVVHINYKLKTTDQAADFDAFEVSVVDMLLMKLWVILTMHTARTERFSEICCKSDKGF